MTGLAQPKRVLIIRPSALGDVCRTVPVLVSLRTAFPEAAIDWVVQEEFTDAVSGHPGLTEVIPFPRRRLARWWSGPARARELMNWMGSLRGRRYDLVIDCQGLGRSGLMSLMTGAPVRVGLAGARELGWFGYTIRHRPAPRLHTVDEMLSLLEPIGVAPVCDLRLFVRPQDLAWWRSKRQELDVPVGRYAVLAPSSRWASKRWPLDRWQALTRHLGQHGFERVIVIGAPSEVEQVAPLAEDRRILLNLTGQTTIGQGMAILAGADLVVANDSAPLHMAVGLERPCVGLFGPTDPERVGPYGRREAVVRAYRPSAREQTNFKDQSLGDRLMRLIEVEEVIAAIERVLPSCGKRERPGAGSSVAAIPMLEVNRHAVERSGPFEEAAP